MESEMKTIHYANILLSATAFASLSVSSSGFPSVRDRSSLLDTSVLTSELKDVAPGRGSVVGLGGTGTQLFTLDYSVLGAPNLTAAAVKKLKTGDHVAIPLPEGGALDYVVSGRSWTAADEQQVHLRSGASGNTTYGIISQVGPRLTGFFQRRDGVSYALVPTADGWSRVVERPDYGDRECGVGRVEVTSPSASRDPTSADGGLAGAVDFTCPPDVTPWQIPEGLKRDSGILIDVLFVFSVDATEAIQAAGSTPYDQAVLTVAQANLALRNSTEQAAIEFNGRDENNELNDTCGYGGPYAVGGDVDGDPAPPAGPFSCDRADPAARAEHLAKAGVDPAEANVCTPRIRLVAALVCDGFFGAEEPYTSAGTGLDLTRVEDPTDGTLDYVPEWRTALGADAVCFVGAGYTTFGGLANGMGDTNNAAQAVAGLSIPANPHPIVDETNPAVILGLPSTISTLLAFSEQPYCLVDVGSLGSLTYAHELGHNLGCAHNHEEAPGNAPAPEDALFPDSFGFRDDDAEGGFRTVMSYGDDWTQLPGFSNPNKTWFNYGASEDDEEPAGKAFDFRCMALDETGTGANYVLGSGVLPGQCQVEGDDDPADPAAMVVATDSFIEDNSEDCAYNARSISQAKFDFAKFRCSIFAPVDCNNNQVDDFIESVDATLDGGVQDCNGNGVPDACETAAPDPGTVSPNDCNENGTPDSCEILDGTSEDQNQNGIPDECEDSTLLFQETFENLPYGFHDGEVRICKLAPLVLNELRVTDPEFPEYFATIESTDFTPDPVDGGFIYSDIVPGLFQYALGENGNLLLYNTSLRTGFATAMGNRGYGQQLDFNPLTGDFPSGNGITVIRAARRCARASFRLNAADFQDYFAEDPPLSGLPNHPYLLENLVYVEAVAIDPDTGLEDVVWQTFIDVREVETPFGVDVDGMLFVEVQAPGGEAAISFDKIVLTGAFVVIDSISLDRGQVFDDCPPDIAGGVPTQGIPVPDGRVQAEDLLVVLAYFGTELDPADPVSELADITQDGFIDSFDLVEILAAWGQCPGG